MKSYKWIIGLLILIFSNQSIAQEIEYSISEFEPKFPNPKSAPITIILPMIHDSSSFYVGTDGEGIFQFPGKGEWIPLNDDLKDDGALSVTGLAWLKAKNQTILCLGSKDGLFISYDWGKHWQTTELSYKINCLTAVSSSDSLIFAGTDNGIFEINFALRLNQIALKSRKIEKIKAGTNNFGTYILYVLANDTLYQIRGSKNEYFTINIANDYKINPINDYAINPLNPELIYIGMKKRGLLRAEEGGKHLLTIANQGDLPWYEINNIYVDSQKPNEVYVTYFFQSELDTINKKAGIYASSNFGELFQELKYKNSNETTDEINPLDNHRFSKLQKLSDAKFVIGNERGNLLLFYKSGQKIKHGFLYRCFWEGEKRDYIMGAFTTFLAWALHKLCYNEKSKGSRGLPNPPDFPSKF